LDPKVYSKYDDYELPDWAEKPRASDSDTGSSESDMDVDVPTQLAGEACCAALVARARACCCDATVSSWHGRAVQCLAVGRDGVSHTAKEKMHNKVATTATRNTCL
jgi:hypothetical protein